MPTKPHIGVPRSLLDTDLYKLTMQQAVLHHFPDSQATYRFTHRDNNVFFTRECIEAFQTAVSHFSYLALTSSELEWLRKTCPFFKAEYLDYLSSFHLKPEQVKIQFVPVSDDGDHGHVEIEVTGPWVETIFWEVPLMACLSEIYFRLVVTDWSYDGQTEIAYNKAHALLEAGCVFSEFGTRRRRSFFIQDLVVETVIRASKDVGRGMLSGTSNVHLAHKHGITPVGTIAHEWFMGVAALKGYENANMTALDLWEDVYPDGLLFALTDTFSTDVFFKNFAIDPDRPRRWKGLRHDSGDPFLFAPRAKEMYAALGIDHREKSIIFSDSLNLDKALQLKKQCDEIGFKSAFGIGTFLTNDFSSLRGKSKALNMVIKIASLNSNPCVKISDDLSKSTGDEATVRKVKKIFGLSV